MDDFPVDRPHPVASAQEILGAPIPMHKAEPSLGGLLNQRRYVPGALRDLACREPVVRVDSQLVKYGLVPEEALCFRVAPAGGNDAPQECPGGLCLRGIELSLEKARFPHCCVDRR